MRLNPVPPGLEPPLALLLTDLREGVRELSEPTKPERVYGTTVAEKPAASAWTNCLVFFTDLNALGVSNGTDWIRTDTGATV